jgi:hypothetical protein
VKKASRFQVERCSELKSDKATGIQRGIFGNLMDTHVFKVGFSLRNSNWFAAEIDTRNKQPLVIFLFDSERKATLPPGVTPCCSHYKT